MRQYEKKILFGKTQKTLFKLVKVSARVSQNNEGDIKLFTKQKGSALYRYNIYSWNETIKAKQDKFKISASHSASKYKKQKRRASSLFKKICLLSG